MKRFNTKTYSDRMAFLSTSQDATHSDHSSLSQDGSGMDPTPLPRSCNAPPEMLSSFRGRSLCLSGSFAINTVDSYHSFYEGHRG